MGSYAVAVYMLLVIMGIILIATLVTIVPSFVMAIWESVLPFFKAEYEILYSKIDLFLIDLKEHYEFLEREKGRHRTGDIENFFGAALAEMREIKEGRRLPVSING